MNSTERRRVGRTGLSITATGIGGAGIGNLYKPADAADVQEVLALAWDRGIRFFDTAPYYGFGLSERRFGDAVVRSFGLGHPASRASMSFPLIPERIAAPTVSSWLRAIALSVACTTASSSSASMRSSLRVTSSGTGQG